MIKTGNEIGTALLQAAGIPTENVHRVTLVCEAGKAAKLTVDAYLQTMPMFDLTTEYRVEKVTRDWPPRL